LNQHGFSDNPATSLDRLAINPSRYTGGLLQPTVTRYLWKRHHIPTVQIELSAWVRVVDRLPSASNAKNNSAPHFRGDPDRVVRVYNALLQFLQEVLARKVE
jgi:hypothetical protein